MEMKNIPASGEEWERDCYTIYAHIPSGRLHVAVPRVVPADFDGMHTQTPASPDVRCLRKHITNTNTHSQNPFSSPSGSLTIRRSD